MRASLLSLLLIVSSVGSLLAADITPADAAKHVGEKVTVRGTVVQAVYSPGLARAGQVPNPKNKSVYLNFGANTRTIFFPSPCSLRRLRRCSRVDPRG